MMDTIVNEGMISFKELEEKIFALVCELGREITKSILERNDKELCATRDTKMYRNKGLKDTSIKTLYGEVEYSRRCYKTILEDGTVSHVFLLDEAMKLDKIGLISSTLAERIAYSVTEETFRATAESISTISGQTISAQGVWNLVQKLGERVNEEEASEVSLMNSGALKGENNVAVLFEEMDGVWLKMQGPHHEKMPKQEMKVAVTYEGWTKEGKKTYHLKNKRMIAGMEKSDEFHEKREAQIEKYYDVDEIQQRILNGDGGSWIKEPYDPDAIIQLDRFHIYQSIKRLIKDKEMQTEIERLFNAGEYEEMLKSIKIYADSIDTDQPEDKGSINAMKLHKYLQDKKDTLSPYTERGIEIPMPEEGVYYRNMGVQENQNCSLITLRMKHRRMRWSVNGANNMAKLKYRKANNELSGTIERYREGLIFNTEVSGIVSEIISAAKAAKKDGKGNPYLDRWSVHMPLLDALQTASRKEFRKIIGI